MNPLDFNTNQPLSPNQLDKLIEKAHNGDFLSCHHLGLYYLSINDAQKAMEYLKTAADNSISMSACVLGDIYMDGTHDIERNDRLAIDYYNMAAAQDDIDAIKELAIIHYKRFLDTGATIELSLHQAFADKAKELGYADIYNYIKSVINK